MSQNVLKLILNTSSLKLIPFAANLTQFGCQICHPKWVRLAPNGTNLGLFKISFSTFWLAEPKCTETDLKKSQICRICGQSDPIWMANITPLAASRAPSVSKSMCRYRPRETHRMTICRQWRDSLATRLQTDECSKPNIAGNKSHFINLKDLLTTCLFSMSLVIR